MNSRTGVRVFLVIFTLTTLLSTVIGKDFIYLHQPLQDTLTWKILNNLEYKEAKHEQYGTVYLPDFSFEIVQFANKKVIIRGYIIPVDKTTYALSKNVYAACFFCGKSGPETVMGLNFKENPGKLKMDSNALLTGYFRLNGTNVDDWMYSLDEVEIIHIK